MSSGTSEIPAILLELEPVIRAAVTEFPDHIAQGETKVEDAAVFFLQSDSTLVKSMLVYVEEGNAYCRRDVLDLNVPDVVFDLANQSREDSIETHDFVYRSPAEVTEAYRHWFTWAVALLRKERLANEPPERAHT